jgi:hypothetical protein
MVAFFFEVMDKEPWIWDIWLICLPIAVLGYFICRKRFQFLGAILVLVLLLLFYALPEIEDSEIRNAIIHEYGNRYYLIRVFAPLFVIFLSTIGAILNVKNQEKRNSH